MLILTKIIFTVALTLSNIGASYASESLEIQTNDPKTSVHFTVKTAKTIEEQQKGLMFVTEMSKDEGMAFIYNQPHILKFWMKDTLIPLDILFFDHNNTLIHIEKNMQPGDLTPRGPDKPVCMALEINGGYAEKLSIDLGSKLISDLTQECLQSVMN